jgi:hypothetical protein
MPFLSLGKLSKTNKMYDGCFAYELHYLQNKYLIIHRLAQGEVKFDLPRRHALLYQQNAKLSGRGALLSTGGVVIMTLN